MAGRGEKIGDLPALESRFTPILLVSMVGRQVFDRNVVLALSCTYGECSLPVVASSVVRYAL